VLQGVVYRDLKPENILLDKGGHVKLADFGLAKENVTEAAVGATSLCGTPEYLSPEVLDRQGHGTAVDWWNLGMVTYEMLTGLPPWYTTDKQKLFDRLRKAPLKFPFYVSKPAASFIYVSSFVTYYSIKTFDCSCAPLRLCSRGTRKKDLGIVEGWK